MREIIEAIPEDQVLKPGDIEVGLTVVIYSSADPAVQKIARFAYEVKALQSPFIALESVARPDFRVLLDLRRVVLMELSPEMRTALETVDSI